jgi:hypothetical protein
MGLFSRNRVRGDRVDSERIADFGRFWLLQGESGLDSTAALEAVDQLLRPLYENPPGDAQVAEELRRHAAKGEWEALGAWQFARDFVQDEGLERELTDLALLTLEKMRITNLSIHLPRMDVQRFEELTGAPAPDDGFYGPPVFDSRFGPSREERERDGLG